MVRRERRRCKPSRVEGWEWTLKGGGVIEEGLTNVL